MLVSALVYLASTQAGSVEIHVNPTKVLHPVSKDLYGIFFEEINCAGDGGIYPELIRNRSFDEGDKADFWNVSKSLISSVRNGKLHVNASESGSIRNDGYWGMHFAKGQAYNLTISGDFDRATTLQANLTNGSQVLSTTKISFSAGNNQSKTIALSAPTEAIKGSLSLEVAKGDKFALDYVSLFPKSTFKNRSNGLRPGLMSMLQGMKPAFMRFPGGCWVEGDRMAQAYRWKTTINTLPTRPTVPNLWGYKSTNGLGYHEYLQMCEDLGAAPLFVVNCGMSHKEVVPLNQMDEYVQDALDAIEYANGPVSSKWGAIRAANGHAKPFNLKYLEIGNENGGQAYEERYKLIFDAVKKKYPEIITIADVWGGVPQKSPIETIDEHYYNSPEFFFNNAHRYDTYSRKGPKVYVGEYAVTQGSGSGNHIGALGEAAFMTGMERNSDHVIMSSYAPLFANVNAKAWNPDLIYFDTKDVYGTPSYYVQQMFAQNRASHIVESNVSALPEYKQPFQTGSVGVGTWRTQAEYKDLSIVENGVETKLAGGKAHHGNWSTEGGIIRQKSEDEACQFSFPETKAKSYTFKLKARKLSGEEGFLVNVGFKDTNNYMWINLGGWGNTVHAIELAVDGSKNSISQHVPGKIETGRWYDIEVDYSPEKVVCRLDGKTIFNEAPKASARFFYTAGIDKARKEIVVKVVQARPEGQSVSIDLGGVKVGAKAKGVQLTSTNALAENSLEKPKNVYPIQIEAKTEGGKLKFVAPPYSVSIWRIPYQQ